MGFTSFVNEIKYNNWKVFGIEVYKDGKLLYSYGDTCDNLHEVYSATKSILSIAVGIAHDRGLIDLNKSLLEYIPKERVNSLPQQLIRQWNQITIERLLTMSVVDLPFRPEGDDFLQYSLSCEISDAATRQFNYSNISAYLVGVALTHAIGSDVAEFIEKEIFNPLGIERYELDRSPEGYFYGASGAKLTVNGLSRIGLMLFQKGMFDGKRIVSSEYVKKATTVSQMNKEGGYGYFFWKYRDGFSINGKWKQKCYVLPREGIMISYLSHIEDDTCMLIKSMENNLLDDKNELEI